MYQCIENGRQFKYNAPRWCQFDVYQNSITSWTRPTHADEKKTKLELPKDFIKYVPKLACSPCSWICPLQKCSSWRYLWSCRITFFSSSSLKKKKEIKEKKSCLDKLKWPLWEENFWWLWKIMVREFVLLSHLMTLLIPSKLINSIWSILGQTMIQGRNIRFTLQNRT